MISRFFNIVIISSLLLVLSCGSNEPDLPVNTDIDLGPAFFQNEVTRVADKINPSNHFNGDRGEDQLIVYTRIYGNQTETNPYGVEAVVKDGIVVKVGGNNSPIPEVGMVISGHGQSAQWINNNIQVGCSVTLSGLQIKVNSSENSVVERALIYIENGKNRLETVQHPSIVASDLQERKSRFDDKLQIFVDAKADGDSANVQNLANDVLDAAKDYFYYTFPSVTDNERSAWLEIQGMSKQDIENVFIDMVDIGFNKVCPEVIYRGWAIFPNAPNGLKQYPDFIGRDPMQEMIDLGKKYNIEVIPWVWVFFVGTQNYPSLINDRHDWLAVSRSGEYPTRAEPGFHYFCPGRTEVHEFWLDVYEYMFDHYDLKNLQLDYIRYPGEPWTNDYCYCDECRSKFADQNNGVDPLDITPDNNPELWAKWDTFRENNVNTFVEAVRNKFPEIDISADVVPDQEYSLEIKKQNWSKWLDNDWLNTAYIMSYTDDVSLVETHIDYMSGRIKNTQKGIAGLGPYQGMKPEILIEEIEMARIKNIDGACLFIYNALSEEQKHALKAGPFRNK